MPERRDLDDGASPAQDATMVLLAALGVVLVDIVFVATRAGWTLVDAGLPHTADNIRRAAEERFGPGARPDAIVLINGPIDNAGALVDLVEAWDVPVSAHALELPYLTGQAVYPPPREDAPGPMALLAPFYPRNPVDLGDRAPAGGRFTPRATHPDTSSASAPPTCS